MIRSFALTYPQLMSQAIASHFGDEKLAHLRSAYELAERLFDGLYRGQYVPFICHLVRTASILLSEKVSLDVVLASLLHAAYAVGCFRDFRHGKATSEHRSEVQQAVGAEIESLVFEYDRCPWYTKECVQEHVDHFQDYDERKRNLILMRLVNELEDYLDCGMAYRRTFPYRSKIEAYGAQAIELANRLGHPQLAFELEQVFQMNLNTSLPAIVLTNEKFSYQLPALKWLKKSYFERIQIRGKELIQRLILAR